MSSVPLVSASDEIGEGTAVQMVEGRSLTQIAWGRLRRDKVAMVSLAVIIFIVLAALFAPLITKLLGVDPYEPNTDLISQDGGLPAGPMGRHLLGPPAGHRAADRSRHPRPAALRGTHLADHRRA